MENLFQFEYVERELFNLDGKPSNFRQVFGEGGKNMACPKGSYHIVKTEDVSRLGQAFINKGHEVKTFTHRNGEVIGLKIAFGTFPSKVGESKYDLVITIPNNGGGRGYLSVKQVRLICSNGMVSNRTVHKDNSIKIPHTINYKDSLKMMEQSINAFSSLMEQVNENDEKLNDITLSQDEAMFNLNKWFFEEEFPKAQRGDMTLDDFRKLLVFDTDKIKCYDRYKQLKKAFNLELEYNEELGLELSMYTVYATVTNYLSRRIEKSQGTANEVIKFERASKKLVYFNEIG